MNRPYIICHMLTTLDGKISGAALGTPEAAALAGHYQKLHRLFHADATFYGRTTIAEVFTKGRQPDLAPFQGTILSREDYIADPELALRKCFSRAAACSTALLRRKI